MENNLTNIKTPQEFFTNADELKLYLSKPKTLNEEDKQNRKRLRIKYNMYKCYNSSPENKEKRKKMIRDSLKNRYHNNEEYREKKKETSLISSKKRYLIFKEELKQMKQELKQLREKVKND